MHALRDLCFPPACLACDARLAGGGSILFCDPCLERITLVREPFCTCCGKVFFSAAGGNHLCGPCLSQPWHFQSARAIFIYEEPFAKAVHAFKYGGKTTGLATFRACKEGLVYLNRPGQMPEPDVIVPVPLHPGRLRERGFNQALLLARALFPLWKDRLEPSALTRRLATQPQTGLSGSERRRNLKNAFVVKEGDRIAGQRVLLVDDVFTTGATVDECARTLMQAGAKEVRVFTLARVKE